MHCRPCHIEQRAGRPGARGCRLEVFTAHRVTVHRHDPDGGGRRLLRVRRTGKQRRQRGRGGEDG
jgi:hypothetical protein